MSDIFLKTGTMPPRLSELCLDTIVNDFPRYNYAFTTSKDVTLKRLLEFLRIKYSYDLLVRLCVREDSMEEYMEFLINKYLRSLDTAWLRNSSWERVVSKMAEIGSNLEALLLQPTQSYIHEQPPWQDIMCYLPNVKRLMCRIHNNDSILKSVAQFCHDIEEINLEHSTVTLEGAKYLCQNEKGEALCTKLKRLRMHPSYIRYGCVQYLLENLPSLEFVDYHNLQYVFYFMHKDDLPCLNNCGPYNIINLVIAPGFDVDLKMHCDTIKICLSVCPRLKYLTYLFNNKEELTFPTPLSELVGLYIQYLNKNPLDVNINEVLKFTCRNLTSLTICSCTVSLFVIAESCPHLKFLKVDYVYLFLDGNPKALFYSLSYIVLNLDTWMNAKAIGVLLSSSKNLNTLKFERCFLSSEVKVHILKSCERYPIKRIFFNALRVEKEYVKELLLTCPSVIYLNLYNCFIEKNDQNEILKTAENIPNRPKIDFNEMQE